MTYEEIENKYSSAREALRRKNGSLQISLDVLKATREELMRQLSDLNNRHEISAEVCGERNRINMAIMSINTKIKTKEADLACGSLSESEHSDFDKVFNNI